MNGDLRDGDLYEARFGYKEQRSNMRFIITILLTLFFVLGFRWYWTSQYGGVIVDGPSMNKTLYNGEKLLMRYVKEESQLKRGDIVVVYVGEYPAFQDSGSKYLIKRLIAMGGDKVKCIDGQIYLWKAGETGYQPLDESGYAYYRDGAASYDFEEYTVDEGEIFFLGDNRNNSCDSRYLDETGTGSRIDDLYKASDVYGIVPQWAVEKQKLLEKIFF